MYHGRERAITGLEGPTAATAFWRQPLRISAVGDARTRAADTMAETRERIVETNGVALNVVEAGAGTPVVLAHGFPELAYSWRHQIPALAAAGCRVIAPDQRGYGRSSRPDDVEDYDIEHLTGDLVGLLDELERRARDLRGARLGFAGGVEPRDARPRTRDRDRQHECPVPSPGADAAGGDDARRVQRLVLLHRLLPGAGSGRCRARR